MGIFDDFVGVVGDAVDVTVGLATFGEYGDISKEKVVKLVSAGLTIAATAAVFGVAEDVIEKMLGD